MEDTPLRHAERLMAEGDYVRAVEELEKASPSDPQVARVIRSALDRMKLIAAREFAVGRWTVAEGIFDAVQEHDQFLSAAGRQECQLLVKEIERCRDREKDVNVVVRAAAYLAAEGRYAQSREVALRVMQNCADLHLVARLRRLLMGLPHPLGRLVYGFDSKLEVEHFTRAGGGARLTPVVDESHQPGGGFAQILFPGTPAAGLDLPHVALLDPPPDWTDYAELSLLLRLSRGARSRVSVQAGDGTNAWTFELAVSDRFWNQVRLPLAYFQKKGEPRWDAVTTFRIVSAAAEPAELYLDEIRLKPKAKGPPGEA
jgi:hypothetical protein